MFEMHLLEFQPKKRSEVQKAIINADAQEKFIALLKMHTEQFAILELNVLKMRFGQRYHAQIAAREGTLGKMNVR